MPSQGLQGGFANAPIQAAYAFRGAMRAMARPGTIVEMGGVLPPPPLSVAAGTLILTLCDADTNLHLAGAHDVPEVQDWVVFHTGARNVDPEMADFAVGEWSAFGQLDGFRSGTPEFPDQSATLIVEMENLCNEGPCLSGPGIRDTIRLSLPDVATMRRNAARYPLGLDFFLTCEMRLAALPRSTKIGEE